MVSSQWSVVGGQLRMIRMSAEADPRRARRADNDGRRTTDNGQMTNVDQKQTL